MELTVGDAVLSNSFSWKVADIFLRFSDNGPSPGPTKDQYLYTPKPEIKVCILNCNEYCIYWFPLNLVPKYVRLS
jgi:hypothetical protein